MKKKIICSIILITIAILSCGVAIAAPAETYGLSSRGRIEFTNGTEDPTDDVIFDADDLYNLAAKCQ